MRKFPNVDGRAYKKAKEDVLCQFTPQTYACKKCGWPVVTGYCCSFCKDTSPSEPPEENKKEKSKCST